MNTMKMDPREHCEICKSVTANWPQHKMSSHPNLWHEMLERTDRERPKVVDGSLPEIHQKASYAEIGISHCISRRKLQSEYDAFVAKWAVAESTKSAPKTVEITGSRA